MRRGPILIAAALAVAGCGGGDADGERPVSDAEASRLAETLFNDYDLGGARFELNGLMPDGTRITMVGQVDWRDHTGRAAVSVEGDGDGGGTAPDAAVTEVVWSDAAVLERIPALTALAASAGEPATDFYARPPMIDERHLDAMIQLVTSLGAEQRDNAVLIAQTPGTAWLRDDVLPGTEIDTEVFRYGDRTVYWLGSGGVTLYRFEGNNQAGTRPVVIDLRDHGPQEIEFPANDDVADATRIPDLYTAATGN